MNPWSNLIALAMTWWQPAAWVLGGLLLLVALWLFARRRRRSRQIDSSAVEDSTGDMSALADVTSYHEGYGGIADHPYGVPWIAIVGTAHAQPSTLVNSLAPAHFNDQPRLELKGDDWHSHLVQQGVVHVAESELLSHTDWAKRWRRAVQGLAAERPARPLDALVVAIGLEDLIGTEISHADQLSMLGEQLGELVTGVERHGGMRVPVYIVLTGSEALQGFDAWCEALHADGLDRPLGWAVSGLNLQQAGLGDGGLTARLDEALTSLQMELMRAHPKESARLIALTGEIHDLEDPLTRVLSATLRGNAFHQPVLWRGFWLTGRSTESDQGLMFCRELFERKIFREYRLAEPARHLLGKRGRQIRWAQIGVAAAVLLGSLGLLRLSSEAERVESADRLMMQIEAQIGLAESAPEQDRQSGGGAVRLAALNLLNAMSSVSVSSIATLLAPTSLFADADATAEMAIGQAYDQVVLRAISGRLSNMAGNLSEPAQDMPVAMVEDDLVAAIDRTEQFAKQLDAFINLRELGEIDDLAEVADYALGITLPPDFTENYHLYGEALSYTHNSKLDLRGITMALRGSLERAFAKAARDRFDSTSLEKALDELSVALSSDMQDANAGISNPGGVRLERIQAAISSIDTALSDPYYAWFLNTEEPVSVPFVDALRRLDGLPTLGSNRLVSAATQTELLQSTEAIRRAAVKRILSYGYSQGRLLQKADNGYALAEPLARINGHIGQLMIYMGGASSESAALPDGRQQRIYWSLSELEYVASMVENHRHSGISGRHAAPVELVPMLKGFVETRILSALRGAISRVGRVETTRADLVGISVGDGPNAELQSLSQALPVLTDLIASLRYLEMHPLAEELSRSIGGQALRILAQIDLQLQRTAPYRPDLIAIELWRGEGSPAAALMGVRSEAQLAALLTSRRAYLEQQAMGRALKVVEFLSHEDLFLDELSANMVRRWHQIIQDVEKYSVGDPDSRISQIEQFLLSDLTSVDASTCANMGNPFFNDSDYLAGALFQLQEAVAERCVATFGEGAMRRFEVLAADFMRSLAGRFPFIGDWQDRDVLSRAPSASPATVRRFFLEHGDALEAVRGELQIAAIDAQTAGRAVRFLDQLIQVRQVLMPMLDPRPPAKPLSYQLRVSFRTERDYELGGDQVLDWRLDSGNQANSLRDNDQLLRWQAGDDVTASLRWARNAPNRPIDAADDLTIKTQQEGSWSLFKLLAELQPRSGRLDQVQPGTLEFQVALEPNPLALSGAAQGLQEAFIFMQIELGIEVAEGEVVAVPLPLFPSFAPRLREMVPVSSAITGERGQLPILLPVR